MLEFKAECKSLGLDNWVQPHHTIFTFGQRGVRIGIYLGFTQHAYQEYFALYTSITSVGEYKYLAGQGVKWFEIKFADIDGEPLAIKVYIPEDSDNVELLSKLSAGKAYSVAEQTIGLHEPLEGCFSPKKCIIL